MYLLTRVDAKRMEIRRMVASNQKSTYLKKYQGMLKKE
jgi:hypothetical protein